MVADIYNITHDLTTSQITNRFLHPTSIIVHSIMHFSIISTSALFGFGALAAPPAVQRDKALCPRGLYSNPSCCDVDVLGVADLDCESGNQIERLHVVCITDSWKHLLLRPYKNSMRHVLL